MWKKNQFIIFTNEFGHKWFRFGDDLGLVRHIMNDEGFITFVFDLMSIPPYLYHFFKTDTTTYHCHSEIVLAICRQYLIPISKSDSEHVDKWIEDNVIKQKSKSCEYIS